MRIKIPRFLFAVCLCNDAVYFILWFWLNFKWTFIGTDIRIKNLLKLMDLIFFTHPKINELNMILLSMDFLNNWITITKYTRNIYDLLKIHRYWIDLINWICKKIEKICSNNKNERKRLDIRIMFSSSFSSSLLDLNNFIQVHWNVYHHFDLFVGIFLSCSNAPWHYWTVSLCMWMRV